MMGMSREAEVAVERDQLAEGQALAEDEHAAQAHHRQRAEVGEEVHEREVVRDGLYDPEAVLAQLVVDLPIALGLARLAGERAHHLEPLQILLKDGVEPAERHLRLAEQRPDAPDEHLEQPQDGRDGGERGHGQHRLNEDEEHGAAQQHEQRGAQLHHAAADERGAPARRHWSGG